MQNKIKKNRYYLASLTQAVITYFTQQKYGIRRKSAFVRQKKSLLFTNEKELRKKYVFCQKEFLIVFYD